MPIPKSVMKINKNGVKYESSVDKAQYTIRELSRRALNDVGRYLKYEFVKEAKSTIPGMRKSKKISRAIQSWVPKELTLYIGFGNTNKKLSGDTWYAIQQELGSAGKGGAKTIGGKVNFTRSIPKRGILRNVVYRNIPKIIEIESQYLSALEDEARALSLIDESVGEAKDGGE